MPRGKYVNHKGRSRHFTSPEELEQERKNKEKKKAQRRREGRDEDEETESEEEQSSNEQQKGSDDSDNSSDEDSDDENQKAKGVSGLIEIENPNRIHKKSAEKVTKVNVNAGPSKPELSRREREELDKQRAQANYQKLHAEGKTDQARADLARLAIIKQNRAEAAAKREAEKKEKEDRSAKK